LRKDLKYTSSVVAKLLRREGSASNGSGVAAEATATAVKLAARLATPERLDKETLHEYRLKVKELRNVLQMAGGASSLKFIDDLGEVKDAIGELHDWEELVSIAQKVLDHGKECRLGTELKHIARQKYEHALAPITKTQEDISPGLPAS
jgi:CHAD domain-containing protein